MLLFLHDAAKASWAVHSKDYAEASVVLHRGTLTASVDFSPGRTTIAFAGTQWDEEDDLDCCVDAVKVRVHGVPGKWHRGFLRGVGRFWIELLTLLRRRHRKDAQLVVTGFSLGGALAQALSIYLNKQRLPHVVVTFGSPRIASPKAARWLRHQPDGQHFLVSTLGDPVIYVPPKILGFMHAGQRVVVTKKGRMWWGWRGVLLSAIPFIARWAQSHSMAAYLLLMRRAVRRVL